MSSATSESSDFIDGGPLRPSILVVDDSAINRRILSGIMTKLGFAVYEATQGLEACELFRQKAGIVAVFLDLNMPMLDGWDTARRLREMEAANFGDFSSSCPESLPTRLPVIVCTANDLQGRHGPDATVCSSAISAGADEVLHKPHCMRLSAVELVLDRLLPLWREAVLAAASLTQVVKSQAPQHRGNVIKERMSLSGW